jgi:hypothetical protein
MDPEEFSLDNQVREMCGALALAEIVDGDDNDAMNRKLDAAAARAEEIIRRGAAAQTAFLEETARDLDL